MRARLNNSWGQFNGTVYTDFSIVNPLKILAGPSDNRVLARPIIIYTFKQIKRWNFLLNGYGEFGQISCKINPVTNRLLGFPELRGDILDNQNLIGFIKAGQFSNSRRLAEFNLTNGESELVLEREGKLESESDVAINSKKFGPLIAIPRYNYNWQEVCQSKMGFGRLRRGFFQKSLETYTVPKELKHATLVLLCLYFQLLELSFNTERGAAS